MNPVLDRLFYIVGFIGFSNGYLLPAGNELDGGLEVEAGGGNGEGFVEDVRDVVFPAWFHVSSSWARGRGKGGTYSIHVRDLCSVASTLSRSASVRCLARIIL